MLSLIQNADWAVLHGIHNIFQCSFLDFLMPKITMLGNAGAVWIVSSIAMIISKKYRRYGITMIAALALGVLTGNIFLKNFVARPRPCWLEDVSLLISNPTDYSFPSGHTLASVIGAFILTYANRKFGFAAIPLAFMIAFSRLYLYVHFPSDIAASIILGSVISLAAIPVSKKCFKFSSGLT